MAYGVETILKLPPAASADTTAVGTAHRVLSSVFDGTSHGYHVLLGLTIPPTGTWITWIADGDCYVHWTEFNVAPGGSASATNSMFMPAGVSFDFWHKAGMNDLVVVIQKTAAGRLYRWVSMP